MKNRFTGLIFFILISSCRSNQDKQAEITDTITAFEPVDSVGQNNIAINKSKAIWSVDYDTSNNEFHLRKNKQANEESLSLDQLIQSVNQAWQPLAIELLKVNNDTVSIQLNDATTLSNDMGSAGSEQFIAAVTYTLTEMKNIHYVNFQFPSAGDHAEPGVYSREDFIDFRKKP